MTPVKAIRVGVWFYKKDVTRMLCSLNVGIVPKKEIFFALLSVGIFMKYQCEQNYPQ